MRTLSRLRVAALLCAGLATPSLAAEGPTAAGPIGGTDIRSASLPPPGLYGGSVFFAGQTREFVDGNGRPIPFLSEGNLAKQIAAPFLLYVPETQYFGGSIGLLGLLPIGNQCGNLFAAEPRQCTTALGDAYVELAWSRSFGKLRASKFDGAYPVLEGLSVLAAIGVVIPTGPYDASSATAQALSIGTNIWDVAPSIALTYTSAPIIADGTEFSAKLYWNNYAENPSTNYSAGDLLNLDFAVTERVGRFQVGITGVYAVQIADDTIAGQAVASDGRRGKLLQAGGIVNYDMPEYGASVKLKANTSVLAENTVEFWSLALSWVKKF